MLEARGAHPRAEEHAGKESREGPEGHEEIEEVEDEDELDCDSNQDPVFQSPKETGKKCCKARNEVKLCNEKRRTLISRISDCTNLI